MGEVIRRQMQSIHDHIDVLGGERVLVRARSTRNQVNIRL